MTHLVTLRRSHGARELRACRLAGRISRPAPNQVPDCVKSQFFEMRSNKINDLQSPHAPKTGFSHSLALHLTAYSLRCAAASGSRWSRPLDR
jgi:hypothetical protein